MKFWLKSALAFAMAFGPMPAMAQGINGSEGEAFLKAVEKGDGATAIPMVEEPGSRVVNYRGYKGDTALHIATRAREVNWVGFLLKNGADPNTGDAPGTYRRMVTVDNTVVHDAAHPSRIVVPIVSSPWRAGLCTQRSASSRSECSWARPVRRPAGPGRRP